MSLQGLDITPVLKTLYPAKVVEDMTYNDFPLYAMLPKSMEFYGLDMKSPIKHGRPQGRSATFAQAKANKSNSKYKSFLLERVKDYSMVDVDHEQVEASEKDMGAFVRWLKSEMDGAFETMTHAMGWSVYGNNSGTIGQVEGVYASVTNALAGTAGDGNFIKLKEVDDVVKFEVDQVLDLFSLEVGGTDIDLDGAGTTLVKIASVDRENGIISVTKTDGLAVTLLVANVVANSFIFTDGDKEARMSGLDAWIPATAPLAGDDFFGVDRSVDPTRLAGIRVDGTGLPIEEALTKGITTSGREGAFFDYYFVNWKKYQELQNALGAKVQYVKTNAYGRADIGFTGIQLTSGKRPVTVIADPMCRDKVAYGIKMDTWCLHSLKAPIRILNLDGNNLLRNNNADSSELRVGGYFQMACTAPGKNARVALD